MPAIAAMRFALGLFFVLSGVHKLTNKERHKTFVETLRVPRIPRIGILQWFVPGVEFFGGLGVAVGFLTPLAALGLLVICSVALLTNSPTVVASYKPIDSGRSSRRLALPAGNDVRIDAALFYYGRRWPGFRRSVSEALDWLSENRGLRLPRLLRIVRVFHSSGDVRCQPDTARNATERASGRALHTLVVCLRDPCMSMPSRRRQKFGLTNAAHGFVIEAADLCSSRRAGMHEE